MLRNKRDLAGDGSKAKETDRWLLKPLAANLILVVENLLAVSSNRYLQVLLPTGARPKNKSVVAKTTRSKSDLGCREFVGSKQQQISASVACHGSKAKEQIGGC